MIYEPKIRGGPAGDPGLAALATVVRYYYASTMEVHGATVEERLELFAAFLAGAGPPKPPDRLFA